jgi:hypothetical protein
MGRGSAHDVVALERDAVAVRRVLDEPQRGLVAVGEESLAAAEEDREDQQVVAVDEAGLCRPWASRALPWTWTSPPSVSFRAATSSSDRSTSTVPSPQGAVSPGRVVETTYLGIAL